MLTWVLTRTMQDFGLAFLRLLILITLTIDLPDIIYGFATFTAAAVCLLLCLLIVLLNGIYKNHRLNVLEGSLIANLMSVFISKMTLTSQYSSIVAHIFVSIALLTFLGIVASSAHVPGVCNDQAAMQKVTWVSSRGWGVWWCGWCEWGWGHYWWCFWWYNVGILIFSYLSIHMQTSIERSLHSQKLNT